MDILPQKTEGEESLVPSAWRPIFIEIVAALGQGDYQLDTPILGVKQVCRETATQIREYIADYGDALIDLPDETWDSSICNWMGDKWEVLVDLWTKEEGRSDLVLHAFVTEQQDMPQIELHMVYVP